MERRERPRCRKRLEEAMAIHNCTLEDLLNEPYRCWLVGGMRTQARKMLKEQRRRGSLTGRRHSSPGTA